MTPPPEFPVGDASPNEGVRISDVSVMGVDVQARWRDCPPALHALGHGLFHELSPLFERDAPLPAQKAQLTRAGGRCATDGTPLTMDPWAPNVHQCPRCGRAYRGPEHDQWWAMGAQLWTMERTLHAALLGRMWQRAPLLDLAARLLEGIADRYLHYPNSDNALGPTRPFFSTYLESVWLLNGGLAMHALRDYEPAQRVCARFAAEVIEPSRALIASFPEGRSNRQTWHTAAQLSAAIALGDERAVAPLIDGPHGVHDLLSQGLLDDGSWYEGENYHLFAHRGLWYGVTLLESLGLALPSVLSARFDRGFVTPWLGVLPDGTFPARRDSRYAVSVHQWRFAEWCELGLARSDQPLLATWLQRLYESDLPAGDTGRARSTADIERDEPPCALSRDALGWRTLLWARVTPAVAPAHAPDPSVVLPVQGLSVLRADEGRIYVALEGGHPGGGHGHPDRLALTIQDGRDRVLEDPGTGSYVERTLHWYRSTLAHNAPLIDGRSQDRVPTELLAFDAAENGGWLRAHTVDSAPGVRLVRTVVLFDTHVVDHVEWFADRTVTIDLPMHVDANVSLADATGWQREARAGQERADAQTGLEWSASDAGGAAGLEDGFDFLRDAERAVVPEGTLLRFDDLRHPAVSAWYAVSPSAALWRAFAPGPPGSVERRMHWWRARGASGFMVGVWSLRADVAGANWTSPDAPFPVRVQLENGDTAQHEPVAEGWRVVTHHDGDAAEHVFRGLRESHRAEHPELALATATTASPTPAVRTISSARALRCTLAEPHYRRSEQRWDEAGSPTAHVSVTATPAGLLVIIDTHTGPVVVPPAGAANPHDNERADVNADGVQCYLGPAEADAWSAAWLLVPDPVSGAVRQTPLVNESPSLAARWQPTETGWQLTLELPRAVLPTHPGRPFRFDLLVNERPVDRARRRGQLVLSGARGAFVYLRGDRHDPRDAWLLQLDASDPPLAPHA